MLISELEKTEVRHESLGLRQVNVLWFLIVWLQAVMLH
jgi:hypothetical protein